MLILLTLGCADIDATATVGKYGATALVTWTTDEPATSKVSFGETPDYGSVTPRGDTLTTDHAVLVAGLRANTEYNAMARSVTAEGVELESRNLSFTTPASDPDLAVVYPDLVGPDAQPSPMILTTVSLQSGVIVLDTNGQIVWWRDLPKSWVGAQAYLSEDGTEVIFNVADTTHTDPAMSEVHRVRLDGGSDIRTPTPAGHHDFVVLEDDSYAVITADMREYDAGGDGTMDTVAGDAIVEIAPDGTVLREVWNTWDHLPVTVTEETSTKFYPDALDWTHMNGLWVTDDAYYLSSHALSTIFKIDRATGNLIWRIGSRMSDFSFAEGTEGFSEQHAPRWVNGNLLVFNNTNCAEGTHSYAVEYALDESTMEATEVRRYNGDASICSQVLGNIDVLDNGNWLVNWGTGGLIEEVDASDEVHRRFSTGIGFPVGNAHYTAELGGPIRR